MRLGTLWMAGALLAAQPAEKRTIQSTDLPPAFRSLFPDLSATVRDLEASTAARLREGENDHLIFYVLQSRRFTTEPRIEPALSAQAYVDRHQISADVKRRMADFLQAPLGVDERLADLRARLKPTRESLLTEYARAMNFLYEKEFRAAKGDVARLYQTRGHSSDTQVEANYAIWNALGVLKATHPDLMMERVLVIGPGLDFAPRMDLFDELPPQSYQPYALADALLSLKAARPSALRIQCADINLRVLGFINDFRTRPRPILQLVSKPSDEEYQHYFDALGAAIGTRRGNTIEVHKEVAQAISASRLNILTERFQGDPFDLVVTTNVLLYFNAKELALAMTNIAAMMKPGGYFIHNDLRPELDEHAGTLGLKPVQARTVRVARGRNAPLFDSFAIYIK